MPESPLWQELHSYCLSFDGSTEAYPWDHVDFRIKGKTFVFTSGDKPTIGITVKPLPEHRDVYLQQPGVSVAQYIGRFGWLSMSIQDAASLDLARDMIAESYAVIAKPKKAKK